MCFSEGRIPTTPNASPKLPSLKKNSSRSQSPCSAASDRTIPYVDGEGDNLPGTSSPCNMTFNDTNSKVSNWLQLSAGVKPLNLPEFSSGVREALENNRCHEVWSKMIRELAEYYIKFYPEMRSDTVKFQEIGRMMFEKYRCIERLGKNPWVSIPDITLL